MSTHHEDAFARGESGKMNRSDREIKMTKPSMAGTVARLSASALVLMAWACNEDVSTTTSLEQGEQKTVSCADGQGTVFSEEDGTKLCVISQKIIEVGFDCPPDYVGLQSFGLLAICGGGTSIPAGRKIDFNYSDAFRRDLELAYPQFVPRGSCLDTLCTGHAICLSNNSCELVTSATSSQFMCADGICQLDASTGEPVCDEQCDTTCPEDESEWVCGEDGGRYCRACTAACYGVNVSLDASACHAPPTSRVEQCMTDCNATCGETVDQWFCSSDRRYYCSACEVQCTGNVITDLEQCAGALPPNQSGM